MTNIEVWQLHSTIEPSSIRIRMEQQMNHENVSLTSNCVLDTHALLIVGGYENAN